MHIYYIAFSTPIQKKQYFLYFIKQFCDETLANIPFHKNHKINALPTHPLTLFVQFHYIVT